MTDRILLHCRPKCETCIDNPNLEGYPDPGCKTCKGLGYTDSVMEFESIDNGESVLSETYPQIGGNHRLIRHGWVYDVYDENKTSLFLNKTINPTHLEIITLKECPICGGSKIVLKKTHAARAHGRVVEECPCENCKDGKIEVVTQKILFKPEEYDEAIIKEFGRRITEFIPIGTIKLKSNKELGDALANINSLINGLSEREREILKEGG